MRKLFPLSYQEFQTSFFVVCKPSYSELSIKDIAENEMFSSLLKILVNKRHDNIIHITIFPQKNKQGKFEKIKEEFVESLNNICSYMSILYDNQTIDYMKEISESVYILEREFRTLIEIVFLKEIGVTWYKDYFRNKDEEKIRTDNSIVDYLNNPLDKLNFVDLKNFVEERIKLSKNIMKDKLDSIDDKLESFVPSTSGSELIYKEVLKTLEEIRELSNLKKTGLDVSNIYRHITSDLANEWNDLYYSHRNAWAHNHFLVTRSELEKYRKLSASVLKKIRTEITLLSLLEKDEEFKLSNEFITLTLTNFSKMGMAFCKLKLQIKSRNDQHILQISEATYVEVFIILNILSEFIEYKESDIFLSHLMINPFLIKEIHKYGLDLINHPELKIRIESDLGNLESLLLNENTEYKLKKLEGTESFMKEEVDILLNEIFKDQ